MSSHQRHLNDTLCRTYGCCCLLLKNFDEIFLTCSLKRKTCFESDLTHKTCSKLDIVSMDHRFLASRHSHFSQTNTERKMRPESIPERPKSFFKCILIVIFKGFFSMKTIILDPQSRSSIRSTDF